MYVYTHDYTRMYRIFKSTKRLSLNHGILHCDPSCRMRSSRLSGPRFGVDWYLPETPKVPILLALDPELYSRYHSMYFLGPGGVCGLASQNSNPPLTSSGGLDNCSHVLLLLKTSRRAGIRRLS